MDMLDPQLYGGPVDERYTDADLGGLGAASLARVSDGLSPPSHLSLLGGAGHEHGQDPEQQYETHQALQNLARAVRADSGSRTPGHEIGGDGGQGSVDDADTKPDNKKSMGKEGDKIKRTRQSQSCDACRARKVKCDKAPPADAEELLAEERCTHCRQLDMPCTFHYKPKKRGPPNRYLEKLQAANDRKDSSAFDMGSSGGSGFGHPGGMGHRQHSDGAGYPGDHPSAMRAKDMADWQGGSYIPHGDYGHDRSRSGYSMSGGAPGPGAGSGSGSGGWTGDASYGRPAGPPSATFSSTGWTPSSTDRPHSQSHSNAHAHLSSAHGHSPSNLTAHPYMGMPIELPLPSETSRRSHNPLDMVLPRQLLHQVVNLYFDYVYALIPIIHRPTFMHDLHHGREERPGQEEWTCMTLALVASTLVQVPRSFVALPRREVKQLAEVCYKRGRAYLAMDIESPASVQVCTSLYLLSFTANLLHRTAEGPLMFGALAGTIIRGQWNDPSTYASLSPLEAELRRRIYWLAYGGDRSWAAIEGTSCGYPEEDVGGMPYPLEIDDEFISDAGISEQPRGTTSLISGFVCISRIYKICGHVMDRRRRDKKTPPQGVLLQMRLNEVNDLYDQVMGVMDGCPEPLRLDLESDARSTDGFSEDWDTHASAGIRSLFLDPKASKAVVKDAYLVQQGNIYVAQQMVRYMVILYREDLYELQRLEMARTSGSDAVLSPAGGASGLTRRKSSTRRDWNQTIAGGEEKEQVASDLLAILQKIPIQVIAINSVSLVTKVRFVASSLLDALANPSVVSNDPTPAQVRAALKTQRAQTYLWDFLRILSEIEALYSLDDDAK